MHAVDLDDGLLHLRQRRNDAERQQCEPKQLFLAHVCSSYRLEHFQCFCRPHPAKLARFPHLSKASPPLRPTAFELASATAVMSYESIGNALENVAKAKNHAGPRLGLDAVEFANDGDRQRQLEDQISLDEILYPWRDVEQPAAGIR